ncbi:MAG: cyclic nucleotide-binding domain-containing protein [Chloroflexi bacterium]|nr:cyclic nucleotide-binding domain-containing protein [Chloroflexota bacterium]
MQLGSALKSITILEELKEAQFDRISAISTVEEYGAGDTIFSESSLAKNLYALQKGKVALQMQLNVANMLRRRVTVDLVTPPGVFGWSAVMESRPYMLGAVCLEPTVVLAIDGGGLRSLMMQDYEMGYLLMGKLIKVVASRLEEARQLLICERMITAIPEPETPTRAFSRK